MTEEQNKIIKICLEQGGGADHPTPETLIAGCAKILLMSEDILKVLFAQKELAELEELRKFFDGQNLDLKLIKTGCSVILPLVHRTDELKNSCDAFVQELENPDGEETAVDLIHKAFSTSAIPFTELFARGNSMEQVLTYQKHLLEEKKQRKEKPEPESSSDSGASVPEPEKAEKNEPRSTKPSEETLDDALQKYAPNLIYSPAALSYLKDLYGLVPGFVSAGCTDVLLRRKLLTAIDSGEGLTSFLIMIKWILQHYGVLPGTDPSAISEMKITKGSERDKVSWEDWNKAMGFYGNNTTGFLCLDISDWVSDLKQDEVKGYLKKIRNAKADAVTVFRVPFLEQYVFDGIYEDLADVLSLSSAYISPLSMNNMVSFVKHQLGLRRDFQMNENCSDVIEQCIVQEQSDGSFYGFKTLENIADNILFEKVRENTAAGRENMIITADLISKLLYEKNKNEGDPWERLKRLIGLEQIKQQIREIVVQIKTQQRLVQEGKQIERPVIHMVFKGNPGTGKTEVARLVGKIFRKEGILRKGNFFEYQGRDLCGQYVGQTAPKTSAICRNAYGSVLFIDEAYSLYRRSDYQGDYGREALAALVAEMENHRDDLCVIMAGYSGDMDEMMTGNQGLESRIGYTLEFSNYSREELLSIFFLMIGDQFEYSDDFREIVRSFFEGLSDSCLQDRDFSNARFVRNLYEKTWGKAAFRCENDHREKLVMCASDFEEVINEEMKNLNDAGNHKHPIGFQTS